MAAGKFALEIPMTPTIREENNNYLEEIDSYSIILSSKIYCDAIIAMISLTFINYRSHNLSSKL